MLADKLRAASSSAAVPVFVSSSVNNISALSNTVTAPAGIQNGDLLVAVGIHKGTGLTLTPPSGFNVISFNETSYTVFVATKTAASESGGYTFTWSSSQANTIAILVYRNATRVNTVGSTSYTTAESVSAPSITPTFRGSLLAVFLNELASAMTTPPSGMTLRVSSSSVTPASFVYDQSPQEAVATGDKTALWAGTSSVAASFLIQITNEPNVTPSFIASASTANVVAQATLTINKPTGTLEGDLMVAVMGSSTSGGTTWTGATGWTEVADQNSTPNVRVAYKVAGASEGSSYVFTNNFSGAYLAGCILTYRYADYGTVGSFTSATNPLILPSISPSQSQSLLIAAGGRNNSLVTMGTPTSMTARITANTNNDFCYIVCDQTVAKGPVGTRYMSAPTTVGDAAGIMLSIKPTRSL